MYITEVSLYNFQSHEETHISFVDGVNGLIGTSDAGKSTVLRAIQWCLTNHFSGTNFIRVGSRETRVNVSLSTGYRIERQRGKAASNNFYRLFKDDVLVEEFTGFGLGVPREIREAHGMDLGRGISLNFHHQLETAFLLANSPSQRAEAIGNLDELARVDRAQTELNDELRLRSKELKAMDQEIIALEKEKEQLQRTLDVQSSKKATLLGLIETVEEEQLVLNRLQVLWDEMQHVVQHINERTLVFESCRRAAEGFSTTFRPEDVNQLHHLYLVTKAETERLQEISQDAEIECEVLVERHQYIDASFLVTNRLERLTHELTHIHEQQANQWTVTEDVERLAQHDFSEMDVNIHDYQHLFEHHKRLSQIPETEKRLEAEIKTHIAEAEKQMDEMLRLLTDAKQCYTCGQSTEHITHDCLEHTI